MCHLVVSAAQLEAEHGLQVFSFQEDVAFQAIAEVDGVCEWCFDGGFVDARCEDESQVLRAEDLAKTILLILLRVLTHPDTRWARGTRLAPQNALWTSTRFRWVSFSRSIRSMTNCQA